MVSLQILFKNDELLAVAKPSGLPSQGTRDPRRPSLDVVLRQQLSLEELYPVHRLDVGTSGVMLWALNAEAARELSEGVQSRSWTKVYWALVTRQSPASPGSRPKPASSAWPADLWRVENHLKLTRSSLRDSKKSARKVSLNLPTRSGGQKAITDFRCLLSSGRSALIEARPLTGRTHQIRTHLASSHMPILGDEAYGGEPASRLMLHAYQLRWPWRGQLMEIFAAPPEEFQLEAEARGLDLNGKSC
ncbi:MAG TPA: RNA pseudouridine synthase [Pseudobdellovibrionaceae bacterium]|nr:RNA pseudouridine synthase [Pseudobdellovibrionaceae bacterium]